MTPLTGDPFYLDLYEIFRGIKSLWSKVADEANLSVSHVATLRVLDGQGSCTMSEITEHLRFSNGSATSTIDRLERDGYVVRTHSVEDRRVVRVSLTPSGHELLGRLHSSICAGFDGMIQALSAPDRALVRDGIGKLAGAFRDQLRLAGTLRNSQEDK